MNNFSIKTLIILAISYFSLLTGCSNLYIPHNESIDPRSEAEIDGDVFTDQSNRDTIFGKGGLNLFGETNNSSQGGALGVNSFLWRASLDTIVFMPVSSADPFGGVIITDWHTPYDSPQERFKLNIYILGKSLRADGVRVATFRQIINNSGVWQDAPTPKSTNIKIENAILTRARQIRNSTLIQEK